MSKWVVAARASWKDRAGNNRSERSVMVVSNARSEEAARAAAKMEAADRVRAAMKVRSVKDVSVVVESADPVAAEVDASV